MKKRDLILAIFLGIVLFGCDYSIASETALIPNGDPIFNLQRIYSSNAINEVPFFGAGGIWVESGDNHNDFLVSIPMDGYGIEPAVYRDPNLFTEMENPRPDIPDGSKIIFSAFGKNGKKGIYSIEKMKYISAGNQITLSAKPVSLLVNDYNNWHPSFNSKQGLLAYVSDAAGKSQVFIYNVKTAATKQLTYLAGAASPFLDAQGEWVYFTGIDTGGNSDIYKIKTDGSGLTRLTFDPDIEKYPTLTKYGKWVVYERGTQQTRSVWLMSLDGKIQKRISDANLWASAPCMNYAGTKIVFEGNIHGKKGIYLGEVRDDVFAGATAKEFTPGMDVQKEVVNLSQFGSFTPGELAKLSQYGFFAVPTSQKQLFFTYEENEYKNIPSFVTADNLLQLFHIAFDTSLRKTEERTLLPDLTQLPQAAIAALERKRAFNNDPCYISLKQYFYVFYNLVTDKPYPQMTPADQQVITTELAKIKAEKQDTSAVFPGEKFDYSLFKVRGHYANSKALSQYFKAMSWIGVMTFDTKTLTHRKIINLCADITGDSTVAKIYHHIYEITSFYAGPSDDPNFYDLARCWKEVMKAPLSYTGYDDEQMQQVLQKLFLDHSGRIATFYADPQKNRQKVIGFMGQRYVADSHLFGLLLNKLDNHYLPGGLDLFTALGNQTAYSILRDETDTFMKYSAYVQTIPEAQQIFTGIGQASNESLSNQWLRLLQIYTGSQEKTAPAVLTTPHWRKKKLYSALASWAELKHDTILYGKQVAAECGGGDEPPKVYGYIEPELTFYKTLRQTCISMDQNLKKINDVTINDGTGIHNLDQLLELIDFFILVSDKELKHIPLSEQENEQIRIIGGLLEANTINALDAHMRWWEITSESAKNMAVTADILYFWGQYQTEAVGYADELYVIIPVNGQLYLMRGSILSYYEFLTDQRMSDSQWYELLKTLKIEKRSKWWQKYLDDKKSEIPVPADPYDSGC
jgi:hypothetical protein